MSAHLLRRTIAVAATIVVVLPPGASAAGRGVDADPQPPGTTTFVSADPDGDPTGNAGRSPRISGSGRFVAFHSRSRDLVDEPLQMHDGQVFVRDRVDGTTVLASVSTDGFAADAHVYPGGLSQDGRVVTMFSEAPDLVADDSNAASDVFVRDLRRGRTTMVSRTQTGGAADGDSSNPSVSGDGRLVVFTSAATNLVEDDVNGVSDVFVHDRDTGVTTLVSRTASGDPGNGSSGSPRMSADGSTVVFSSSASDLVGDDTNARSDVFSVDLDTGSVTLLSRNAAGAPANGTSSGPSVSGDGTRVAFSSAATDLPGADSSPRGDVFLHDASDGTIVLVSRARQAGEPEGSSGSAAISADGATVVFEGADERLLAGAPAKETIYAYDVASDELTFGSPNRRGRPSPWAETPAVNAAGDVIVFYRRQDLRRTDDPGYRAQNIYAYRRPTT